MTCPRLCSHYVQMGASNLSRMAPESSLFTTASHPLFCWALPTAARNVATWSWKGPGLQTGKLRLIKEMGASRGLCDLQHRW